MAIAGVHWLKRPRLRQCFHLAIATFVLLLLMPFFFTAAYAQARNAAPIIVSGAGRFDFRDNVTQKTLPVWYYLPKRIAAKEARILFVMHGTLRNGSEYRDQWATLAEKYGVLLLVPEFSKTDFPGGMYNRGNVMGENDDTSQPHSTWSFPVIERIFDYVRDATKNPAAAYDIYGHSAGGQFVHRLVLFLPAARIRYAVAANSGYYTLPELDSADSYPFSLKNAPATPDALKATLGAHLIILLGEKDIDPNDPDLYHSPEADKQGMIRFARGHTFFDAGRASASHFGTEFNWRLVTVPGVGHDNAKMAPAAATLLYGEPKPPLK